MRGEAMGEEYWDNNFKRIIIRWETTLKDKVQDSLYHKRRPNIGKYLHNLGLVTIKDCFNLMCIVHEKLEFAGLADSD